MQIAEQQDVEDDDMDVNRDEVAGSSSSTSSQFKFNYSVVAGCRPGSTAMVVSLDPSFKWWEVDQMSLDYDDEEKGYRPVLQTWPEGSVLTRDHFTIDQQHCLKCRKKLGYALPMNKPANPKYLFCCDEHGNEVCRTDISYLHCHACGNLNNESTLHVVSKPGNCAYTEATCIYDVMCYHCHKEMMDNEPGVEECKKQMKEIREMRRKDELEGRRGAATAGGGWRGGDGLRAALGERGGVEPAAQRYASSLSETSEKKRKRMSEKDEDTLDRISRDVMEEE
jgi:hypothetical protein